METTKRKFLLWLFPFQIYFWVCCIGCGTSLVIDCVEGHKWISHIIYIGFLGIVFLIDAFFLYTKLPSLISKYRESEQDYEEGLMEDADPRAPRGSPNVPNMVPQSKPGVKLRKELAWWVYCEVCSILGLLDFYTDVCFIVLSYKAHDARLTIPSLICLICSSYLKIFAVGKTFVLFFKKSVSGQDVYNLFMYNEMQGNGYLVRDEVTSVVRLRGKVLTSVSKFFLEDLIQMVLQIIFLNEKYCDGIGEGSGASAFLMSSIVISVLLSLLTLIKGKKQAYE